MSLLFTQVKSQVTTRQAAERYGVPVNRSGMACCPFHDDRHPSMKIDERFYWGFRTKSSHEMKYLFSGTRFHGLQKPAPEHSSKQGKGSTFCTLLVGEQRPQAPFTSASAVVFMRISGIRHRGRHRVHRSGDLLV